MSTLHKVKAYFGMAPMDDYDDEYYEDDHIGHRDHPRGSAHGLSYAHPGDRFSGDRFADDQYASARFPMSRYDDRDPRITRDYSDSRSDMDYPTATGFRGYADETRLRSRDGEHPHDIPHMSRSRFGSLRGSTRGALAMDPRRMAVLFDEGSPLSKITTLRPKDYSEARTIGERFRDGQPVIMDLVSMDTADAKRLVDFAAGLAFALRGSFDKVATKVFLLSPADIDVTAEQRQRIAEAGFYSYPLS